MDGQTRFRDLDVGDTFDFVDPSPAFPSSNSFTARCTKTGTRTYKYRHEGWGSVVVKGGVAVVQGAVYEVRVGSINARVFNIAKQDPAQA